MDFFTNIVAEIGVSDGLKLVLGVGFVFAFFVFWRLRMIVKALNKVEDTARREIRDVTKVASECKGQIDIIKKVVLKGE